MFVSWVLFAAVLPIDRHRFMLAHVDAGHGFVEDSTSWSQRRWEHRRHLEPYGERRCIITDRLSFTPRVAAAGAFLASVIGVIFRHRHRRLRERFGGRPIAPAPTT
jgi:ligand-binding SRPBCC domain-containing protein